MKILTFQIPEELFQRLKDHLAGRRNGQEKESVRRNSSWLSSSRRWMSLSSKSLNEAPRVCGASFLLGGIRVCISTQIT